MRSLQPKKRTKWRLVLGKIYFTYKRYLQWLLGKEKFARTKQIDILPHVIFQHQTPLYRALKDVDRILQYNKVINLKLAAAKLNHIVIMPGETFSYWKLIGKPTKRKGYVEGMVLFCGTFKAGIGGGLCQMSNLIYWMTIHTSLTVTERYRHSFDVFPDSNRSQPFGSGATCVYNYRDLMIKNTTSTPYQLCVEVKKEHLVGQWRALKPEYYTYKVYEKNHEMRLEPWGGYTRHNKIYRQKIDCFGERIEDEYIAQNHAMMMYPAFLESKGK